MNTKILNRKHRELTERVTVGDCVINLMTSSQKTPQTAFHDIRYEKRIYVITLERRDILRQRIG